MLRNRLDAALERRREADMISPYVILNEHAWKPLTSFYYAHLFAQIRTIAAAGMPASPGRAELKPMPSLIGEPDEGVQLMEDEKLLPLRDHDLRDTAVTWLALGGATIPEICAVTGHSLKSAYEILKHYLDLNDELADSAMAKMVAYSNGLDDDLPEQETP